MTDRAEVIAVLRELVAVIDTQHGWHTRAILEGALAKIDTPAPPQGDAKDFSMYPRDSFDD